MRPLFSFAFQMRYSVMFSGGCLCKSLFFGRDAAILCEQDDLVSGC